MDTNLRLKDWDDDADNYDDNDADDEVTGFQAWRIDTEDWSEEINSFPLTESPLKENITKR